MSARMWWTASCVRLFSAVATAFCATAGNAQQQPAIVSPGEVVMVGDAIPAPLTRSSGEAMRGQAIVLDRAVGNCLICHKVPVPNELFQGTIGPDLAGIAKRLSAGQIRLRLVDQSRLNPATIMPPFYRVADLLRVDERYRGKTALSATEIEDITAYLITLRD